jgi:hypothetical protein
MMQHIYRYTFSANVDLRDVEATLILAVLGAESLYGTTDVRLDATHFFDVERRTCVISADTEVGRDLNRLFAGYLSREYGPDAFSVMRILKDERAEVLKAA